MFTENSEINTAMKYSRMARWGFSMGPSIFTMTFQSSSGHRKRAAKLVPHPP
ncbi:hypothetical protein FKM82_014262 [Ascaphus truei]